MTHTVAYWQRGGDEVYIYLHLTANGKSLKKSLLEGELRYCDDRLHFSRFVSSICEVTRQEGADLIGKHLRISIAG